MATRTLRAHIFPHSMKAAIAGLFIVFISANALAADGDNTDFIIRENVPMGCTYDILKPTGDTATFIAIFEPNVYTCRPGYYLPTGATECAICPENHWCPGGAYTYSETATTGIHECPTGLVAPVGMYESGACGKILHIGDATMYLRQQQKTTPALKIDINNDGVPDFFGNATTSDTPINNKTQHKLQVMYNGKIMSIYDDTITLD